jgi:hypothetical protein
MKVQTRQAVRGVYDGLLSMVVGMWIELNFGWVQTLAAHFTRGA